MLKIECASNKQLLERMTLGNFGQAFQEELCINHFLIINSHQYGGKSRINHHVPTAK